jgi:sugar O-acyltransferase (sialic acid O-acetyltransferase NeuD family)
MKKIVLFGGGNQVHYTLDIIEKQGLYKVIGIIDSVHDIGSERFGYKVIGRQEDIKSLIEEYEIEGGIITIGDNWIRYYVSQQIKSLIRDFEFVNAIHPSVVIGNNVQIGTGVVAMAGVIINPMAKIGNHTFFATGSQIEHDCIIEDFASVSAGSILGGYVQIKKYSAITLNVTILDRLIIGENCVVGSGSLVLKDIPDNILAYGNPCKNIRYRPIGEKFLK